MKWFLPLTFLLFTGIVALAQTNNPLQNKKIPSVDIKDIKGDPFNTRDIKNDGKPIVINFWATWCKPCIKELTAIADLYDEWREETSVKIYAVSIDNTRSSSDVAALISGKAWEYVVLLDQNSDFKRAMNVGPIPHTFLINGKGEVVWQGTTYAEGNELELYDKIRKVAKGEELK
jgi:cytochrome c biogenesis protein CcmG/thiol:disulfide interchange protein DsbE